MGDKQPALTIDAAYAAGLEKFLSSDPLQRSALTVALYVGLVPEVDRELANLQRLRGDDPPPELAIIAAFVRQWTTLRNLLSPIPAMAVS